MHRESQGGSFYNVVSFLTNYKDVKFGSLSFYFSNSHDEEKLNEFLEFMMTGGIVLDGTVASTPRYTFQSETCML